MLPGLQPHVLVRQSKPTKGLPVLAPRLPSWSQPTTHLLSEFWAGGQADGLSLAAQGSQDPPLYPRSSTAVEVSLRPLLCLLPSSLLVCFCVCACVSLSPAAVCVHMHVLKCPTFGVDVS